MDDRDRRRIQTFLDKWQGSQGNERANYQVFFDDLCGALAVDRPPPKGNVAGDPYCFDKEIKVFNKTSKDSTNFADFYKEGHFLVEAKQGGTLKQGTARRGTRAYDQAMEKAFYQAQSYTPFLPSKPPFLMTCDIGSHFELWMSFSGNYGGYGAREKIEINRLLDPKVFDRFVAIFQDPQSLNPEKYRAKVTREVAGTLAKLAKWLEEQGHEAHEVANFLMRCIFTMFAEDVHLLQGDVFTRALQERWIPDPRKFKPQIESLWRVMNTGGEFNFDAIPQFNGSFFANVIAFDLPKEQLKILHEAATKDWTEVEPAIFGTLLERALEKKDRSRLGAHYTPRSYVERLVRPVVMEPLREDWLLVETEVTRLLGLKEEQPTKGQREKAAIEIRKFLQRLQEVRILDPACGSGNFLYVTLDLLKTLEQEVQMRLLDVLGKVTTDLLEEFDPRLAGRKQVNPSQFLGIEINPRAAAIAELVIWIGYLQWHFKRYGTTPPPEPILQDFHNIEFRDAVLAYDGMEPDIDPKTGQERSRWGGRNMHHPVTGKDVPDPSDQVPIYRYLNPRPAEWQEVDYIVSNPPFIGTKKVKEILGNEYIDALRKSYPKIPETIDYVMYWWYKCGLLICSSSIKSFGLITTNSIRQIENRKIIQAYTQNNSLHLHLAIPDHPWVDEEDKSASVRISMTGAKKGYGDGKLGQISTESKSDTPEDEAEALQIKWSGGYIFDNLRIGTDVTKATHLVSNIGLCNQGCKLVQERRKKGQDWEQGFLLRYKTAQIFGFVNRTNEVIKPYITGDDITGKSRNSFVIDFYGLSREQAEQIHPIAYQRILEQVKPFRDQNSMKRRREFWWIFGVPTRRMRKSIQKINRYIITSEVAKHRVFIFVDSQTLADGSCFSFAFDDAYFLGVLSSKIHVIWTLTVGGRMGVGNDPRYNNTVCFDPFPFPDPIPIQKQKIRELGERLDSHRKRVQAQHPEITITGMYNLLEKLRKGEEFSDKDREYNNKALVSTLKQIHDDLDRAVLEAYGWEDLAQIDGEIEEIILDRLVTLNAQRAEEERNGHIRWLRPEYQAPGETITQTNLEGLDTLETNIPTPTTQKTFPKQPKEQLAAIRDLLRSSNTPWSIDQIATQFKNGNRNKTAITENLDRLEWFSILICHEENHIKYWQHIENP